MYKKVLAYLALLLGIAEVVVILVSWLLTAAMPESFTHSLTSPEGIRWFTGHFVDHLTSVWLVWLVLISITIGVVRQSRVLHFDHTQYRQRTALRLMLIELCISAGIMLALTLLPHAILLNAVGTLFPGPFTHSLICLLYTSGYKPCCYSGRATIGATPGQPRHTRFSGRE